MERKIKRKEQLHHPHPLQLIDMQPQYPHYEEEYDDGSDDDCDDGEDDLSKKWDFYRLCKICDGEIKWYHRYYYKCKDLCGYWLHKFCGEIPTTLTHRSHRALNHTLTLAMSRFFVCEVCKKGDVFGALCYLCRICDVRIHVNCILEQKENHPIYHPSHPHPLVPFTSEPILCKCDACGKKHTGIFYHCSSHLHFSIHSDCAFLPKLLSTQHTHQLTLSYSFPKADQKIRFDPDCRICGDGFDDENLWIYKCEICRYYVHLNCATSRGNPGFGKLVKNFEDADHPGLLNLPFRDQTYDVLKHLFFKENGDTTSIATNERNLNHIGHQHPLIMVGGKNLSSCHNPVKKIELLCNGCIRPIMKTPFYKCANENEGCQFFVHVWCTLLPVELLNYQGHPNHKLIFLPKVSAKRAFFNVFNCAACQFDCNGFVYGCVECEYYIDVTCGLLPEKITHEAHPCHLLSRGMQRIHLPKFIRPIHPLMRTMFGIQDEDEDITCLACGGQFVDDLHGFGCHTCKKFLHPECALLLPRMIKHRHDKHSLKLRYLPVENHKSQYFCEICEEELNPNHWFYHCDVCVQSMHPYCFPLITEYERAIPLTQVKTKVFKISKIKFGGSYDVESHQHSLSFSQGISTDGCCNDCSKDLEYEMIFKCLKCKFGTHFECFYRRLNGAPLVNNSFYRRLNGAPIVNNSFIS